MLADFYGYFIIIAIIYGIQSSISQSWYCLPEKYKVIFSVATFLYGLLAFFLYPSILSFLALSGLFFVAMAPAFRGEKNESFMHVLGATTSMILCQALITFNLGLPLISLMTLALLLALEYLQDLSEWLKRTKTTWIEFIIFTSLAVAYWIKLF
jgi:hypothetical protein